MTLELLRKKTFIQVENKLKGY